MPRPPPVVGRRALPLAGRWLLILALLLSGIGTPLPPLAAHAPLPAVAAPPAATGAAPPPLAPGATATAALPEPVARPAAPVVAGLELALSVAPEAVGPGETVTLTVALTNPPSGQRYERLVLGSDLPAGVLPVPNRGDAEIVPGPHPALCWALTGLAVGTTWQGRAQVRLTAQQCR